jgi:hypothetical protein
LSAVKSLFPQGLRLSERPVVAKLETVTERY